MKKIFKTILILVIILSLYIIPVYSTDEAIDDNDFVGTSTKIDNNETKNKVETSTPKVSTTQVDDDFHLTVSDIIDIILIAVGIVLILLAIAILIRIK